MKAFIAGGLECGKCAMAMISAKHPCQMDGWPAPYVTCTSPDCERFGLLFLRPTVELVQPKDAGDREY